MRVERTTDFEWPDLDSDADVPGLMFDVGLCGDEQGEEGTGVADIRIQDVLKARGAENHIIGAAKRAAR